MTETKAVEIRAEVRQIKTMADRTVNVILNLPEDCTEQAKALMDWLGLEVGAVIVAPEKTLTELDDETGKEPTRRTSKVGRRRS